MVEYGESGGVGGALIIVALVAIGHLVVGIWACGVFFVRWIAGMVRKPADPPINHPALDFAGVAREIADEGNREITLPPYELDTARRILRAATSEVPAREIEALEAAMESARGRPTTPRELAEILRPVSVSVVHAFAREMFARSRHPDFWLVLRSVHAELASSLGSLDSGSTGMIR